MSLFPITPFLQSPYSRVFPVSVDWILTFYCRRWNAVDDPEGFSRPDILGFFHYGPHRLSGGSASPLIEK